MTEPSLPTTPPTRAGAVPSTMPGQSTWPTILGVISIIFGLGGFLMYGLCSPAMTFVMPMFADEFSTLPNGRMTAAQFEAIEDMKWLAISLNGVLGLLGLMLLIAGVGLLRRKGWSVRLAVMWAFGKILVTIPNMVFTHQMQQKQFEAMRQDIASAGGTGGPPTVFFGGLLDVLGIIGLAIGLLWAVALPVVMLVWLNRAKVRAEVGEW